MIFVYVWVVLAIFVFLPACSEFKSGIVGTPVKNSNSGPGVNPAVCSAGTRGTIPDYSSAVNQYASQNASQLTQDCGSGSNQFLRGLVTYLRVLDPRFGYEVDDAVRDGINYTWDNGNCEGSKNTTMIDVIHFGNPCYVTWEPGSGVGGTWTLTPPEDATPPTPGCNFDSFPDHTDLVRQFHNQVQPGSSIDAAFQVTMRVAWDLRSQGAGLLHIAGGAALTTWKGQQYSASRMCMCNGGYMVKVIGDIGGTQFPEWLDNGVVTPGNPDVTCVPAIDPNS
jgi:hypothetical protein